MTILIKKYILHLAGFIIFTGLLVSCDNSNAVKVKSSNTEQSKAMDVEVVKGPHGGRLLTKDSFTLELSIFETGVPPEFRAWASLSGLQLKPDDVELNINLTRLGGKIDEINFKPHADALRGDSVIYEPHSFIVTINAVHNGKKYHWQYDNFEGRTKIETAVANALEIKTSTAGPVVLQQNINVYGKITTNTERVRRINARFAGVIKSVAASIGDTVSKGQILASVESNESLNLYSIKAPISGVITQRNANPGEQTNTQALFVITDTTTVWVDLSIFPTDRKRVVIGAPVSFQHANSEHLVEGKIALINIIAETNQSIQARMIVDNTDGKLIPGSYVKAKIRVGEYSVPLAVKLTGLQSFRDFTVVYAQIGQEYEVRMLELGRQDDQWIEVLGGLTTGTLYVSENSYVIKADIEKSGASHDH